VDEARLTKFGMLLRATSLDELPTLVKMLRSKLTLAGPDGCRSSTCRSATHARRYEVRPGITGWAQAHCATP
jgi:sugar transferase EpsL